jgi:hypothetical protein
MVRPAPTTLLYHPHYRSVGCELPDDLELLCRDCHRDRHVCGGQFYADPTAQPDRAFLM